MAISGRSGLKLLDASANNVTGPSGQSLSEQPALNQRRELPIVPDDERVNEVDADRLARVPELLAHGHVGTAGLQVARGMIVRDEHAPGVAQQAEPEHLPGRGDRRVDGPDVTNVGADHTAGGGQGDGQEDL